MKSWFAHALMLAISASVVAQVRESDPAQSARPEGKAPGAAALLNQKIPQVSFQDLPLEQVIDWLQGLTQVNIAARWQMLADAGVPRDKLISLNAKNLRLSQILWVIMNEAGGSDVKLAYRASGNLLILSTEEDLGREMLVRVYDVADLLARFPMFRNGPQVNMQNGQNAGGNTSGGQVLDTGGGNTEDDPGTQGSAGQPGQLDPDMQRLLDLIQSMIQPDSWERRSGLGTISAWRTQIIVRNTILVHQQLGGPVPDGN